MKTFIFSLVFFLTLFSQASQYEKEEDLRRAIKTANEIDDLRLASEKRIYDQDHPRRSNNSDDLLLDLLPFIVGFLMIVGCLVQKKMSERADRPYVPVIISSGDRKIIFCSVFFLVLTVLIIALRIKFEW